MSVNVNSDNRVADIMADLKRHMKYCRKCKVSIKVRDYNVLCDYAKKLVLEAVAQFDTVIPRRLKAVREKQKFFYACPDLGAHSKTYAATAEPLIAVGVQESLF